jgi:hypothetical protein
VVLMNAISRLPSSSSKQVLRHQQSVGLYSLLLVSYFWDARNLELLSAGDCKLPYSTLRSAQTMVDSSSCVIWVESIFPKTAKLRAVRKDNHHHHNHHHHHHRGVCLLKNLIMIIVSFPHPLACSQRSDERHREPAGGSAIPAVLEKGSKD